MSKSTVYLKLSCFCGKEKKWQNLFRFIQKVTNLRIVFGEDIRCMGWGWGVGMGGGGEASYFTSWSCCVVTNQTLTRPKYVLSLFLNTIRKEIYVCTSALLAISTVTKSETKEVILHFSPKGMYHIHLFCIASMAYSLRTNSQCTTCIYKICKQHPTVQWCTFFYNRRSLGAIFCQM
jgi:hypothetical protein